ncbi:hypothetical protein HanPI659440_Chr05g0186571 [Helianthus annuus]|nr:hypothetical protein HanPI659440_Chr05g0186571 [Helianthus annuus]
MHCGSYGEVYRSRMVMGLDGFKWVKSCLKCFKFILRYLLRFQFSQIRICFKICSCPDGKVYKGRHEGGSKQIRNLWNKT